MFLLDAPTCQDLTETNLGLRARAVEKAVFEGRMSIPGRGELPYKKGRGGRAKSATTSIPFHLRRHPREAPASVPSVTVSETEIRVYFTQAIDGDGKISR